MTNDYAYTIHSVGIANNCDKTTRTLSENFEGFSQILKEQSGKKKILRFVYKPNSNNLKI